MPSNCIRWPSANSVGILLSQSLDARRGWATHRPSLPHPRHDAAPWRRWPRLAGIRPQPRRLIASLRRSPNLNRPVQLEPRPVLQLIQLDPIEAGEDFPAMRGKAEDHGGLERRQLLAAILERRGAHVLIQDHEPLELQVFLYELLDNLRPAIPDSGILEQVLVGELLVHR